MNPVGHVTPKEAVEILARKLGESTDVPLVLVENERDATAILDRLTPERRAIARVATVPEGADIIGRYMDAGFTGFTLSNNVYGTDESIALAGELIKVVNNVRSTA